MPITPSPETLRQLESLGVNRAIPHVHKPTVSEVKPTRAQRLQAAKLLYSDEPPVVAPSGRYTSIYAATPRASFDLITIISAFIRWLLVGVIVATLVGIILFAMRAQGLW